MGSQSEAAVATAIALMHEHLARPLRLAELAEAAYLSPFHFDRVFHATTGVSAVAFAAALRIDAAKRLIARGDASVTDACFELGYNSLGSFVSRFSRSVGIAPGTLRATLARDDGAPVARPPLRVARDTSGERSIFGIVRGDVAVDRLVWIGAFSRGIPDGPPLSGTIVDGGGPFRLDALPQGTYSVLAFAVPRATSLRGYLAPDASARVGKSGAVVVGPAGPAAFVTIDLGPPSPTDPPLLVALPLLGRDPARSE